MSTEERRSMGGGGPGQLGNPGQWEGGAQVNGGGGGSPGQWEGIAQVNGGAQVNGRGSPDQWGSPCSSHVNCLL